MSDLEKYIAKRKSKSTRFAKNYEADYEAFEFSVMLRQAREQAGVTQEAVAKQLRTKKICNISNRKSRRRYSGFRRWKNMQRLWGRNSVLKLSAKFPCVHPNQSLKLTEPAVDDFARAKQTATVGRDLPRADWIPSLQHFVAAA